MADIYWTDYLEKLIYLEQAVGHKTHYTILEPFQVERTVIGLQAAARTIADFIGLNEYMFVVAVVNLDGKAAHIELTRSGREVFIEISEHLMSVSGPGVLAALSHEICHKYLHHCQGRSVIPQNRRNRIPRFRRFEKSPASVVLLHRCRQREIAEHASLQLLP